MRFLRLVCASMRDASLALQNFKSVQSPSLKILGNSILMVYAVNSVFINDPKNMHSKSSCHSWHSMNKNGVGHLTRLWIELKNCTLKGKVLNTQSPIFALHILFKLLRLLFS